MWAVGRQNEYPTKVLRAELLRSIPPGERILAAKD